MPLLILDSQHRAQHTQASAFIPTAGSFSQAGKPWRRQRMWHSEILLSWLVSLFLNKALHGVSSAHECRSLFHFVSLSLSSPLLCVPDPFSSLCTLPPILHLAFFTFLLTFFFYCALYLFFCLVFTYRYLYESLSSAFEVIAHAALDIIIC